MYENLCEPLNVVKNIRLYTGSGNPGLSQSIADILHLPLSGLMPLVSPVEFLKGEDGNVCGVRVQKMELGAPDASGRRRPVPIEGAIEDIPCDVAISAIGTNANPFAKMIGDIELNKWGYIVADEEGHTSDPRIWAGGDIVTGAATVILAMWRGCKCISITTEPQTGQGWATGLQRRAI